jgi:hypothetical protein
MTMINGSWCIYSGDVNQDGVINNQDVNLLFNDNVNGITGYTQSDLNGDSSVEIADLFFVFRNSVFGVESKKPENTLR